VLPAGVYTLEDLRAFGKAKGWCLPPRQVRPPCCPHETQVGTLARQVAADSASVSRSLPSPLPSGRSRRPGWRGGGGVGCDPGGSVAGGGVAGAGT